MSMTVTRKVDFAQMGKNTKHAIVDEMAKQVLQARNEIIKRTQAGMDADGSKFVGYSARYAALKLAGKAGKKLTRGSTGAASANSGKPNKPARAGIRRSSTKISSDVKVDLTLTANMLNSIATESKELAGGVLGRLFFNSSKSRDKALGHMTGGGNGKIRRFFELSSAQKRGIVDALKKRIKEKTRG